MKLTNLVNWNLYAILAICFFSIVSNFMQINLLNDYFLDSLYSYDEFILLSDKNDIRVGIISLLYSVLLFLSIILIVRWLYVSAKNNHLYEVKNLKFKPGWAIGWYFIPFANLIMPYRSMKETYKASFKRDDWESISVPYDIPIWWITWLITNILFNVSSRNYFSAINNLSYENLKFVLYIDISCDIFLIVNAIFLIKIVRVISFNQRDLIT